MEFISAALVATMENNKQKKLSSQNNFFYKYPADPGGYLYFTKITGIKIK